MAGQGCSKDLQFCVAKNIHLDCSSLTEQVQQENLKYRVDIFEAGDINIFGCNLDADKLNGGLGLMSLLQSWAPELQVSDQKTI